ncbi:hypothetical protein [Microvirga massiliensis]|uniref:hypothetical protein n=1 Tax=Microvirga massiliensis TaxID=1033741 RepID=UPI0011CBA5E3|nr:hypothetical protein [Microvirga massiliensis]
MSRSQHRVLKAAAFILALVILPVSARTMLPDTPSMRLGAGEPETTRLLPRARTVVPRKLAGEPAGECQRIRRKFWLEDQGWVIRAVSRC